jgi:hypothetical protein
MNIKMLKAQNYGRWVEEKKGAMMKDCGTNASALHLSTEILHLSAGIIYLRAWPDSCRRHALHFQAETKFDPKISTKAAAKSLKVSLTLSTKAVPLTQLTKEAVSKILSDWKQLEKTYATALGELLRNSAKDEEPTVQPNRMVLEKRGLLERKKLDNPKKIRYRGDLESRDIENPLRGKLQEKGENAKIPF